MKKLLFLAILFLATSQLFGQMLQKGNLVGLHVITMQLQPGISEEDAVKFLLEKAIPADEKAYGVKEYLLHGIRGKYADQYGVLVVFKDEQARDKYYAENDEAKANLAKANELLKDITEEAGKYFVFSDNAPVYNDYLFVASQGEPIKKGSMLGVHNLTLKLNENATEDQFIDYNAKYMEAAYEDFDPNMKVSVSKSLRGDDQGKLAYFIIFSSEDARNLYFDKEGKGTQKYQDMEKAIKTQSDGLSKIGTVERVYTDWIVF